MDAIVLAGGKGTRLQSVVSDVPKPMAAVGGSPFLDYLLTWLKRNAVSHVILSIGYKGDVIQARYKSQYKTQYGTINILYSNEDDPLGTGGAIKQALQLCQGGAAFVINGDTFFDVDLTKLKTYHNNNTSDITISVKEMFDFDRYGTVVMSDNGAVISFNEKKQTARGFINGGVYVVNTNIFDNLNLPDKFSFETDVLYKRELNIRAVPFDGNFIDIGIPEDYAAAQELIPQWVAI